MESYIRYIENALSGVPDDPVLFRFKKGILDEMTARANALTATGLHDEQVLSDLVISEHPDLRGEYSAYAFAANKKRRKKALIKWNIIGSVLYVLALVMIVGRLGPMTIAYAISKPHPASVIRYPEESIVVG